MNRWQLSVAIHSAFVRGDIPASSYAWLRKMAINSVDLEATYDTLLKEIGKFRSEAENHGK